MDGGFHFCSIFSGDPYRLKRFSYLQQASEQNTKTSACEGKKAAPQKMGNEIMEGETWEATQNLLVCMMGSPDLDWVAVMVHTGLVQQLWVLAMAFLVGGPPPVAIGGYCEYPLCHRTTQVGMTLGFLDLKHPNLLCTAMWQCGLWPSLGQRSLATVESPLLLGSSVWSLVIQVLAALPPQLSPNEPRVCHRNLVVYSQLFWWGIFSNSTITTSSSGGNICHVSLLETGNFTLYPTTSISHCKHSRHQRIWGAVPGIGSCLCQLFWFCYLRFELFFCYSDKNEWLRCHFYV